MTMEIAREIFMKSVFRRGGQSAVANADRPVGKGVEK